MRVKVLTGAALEAALDDVAALRIRVLREFPYLYDGDLAYERSYLQTYRDSPRAVLVGAFDGARLVGAATGTPMADHADDFASVFAASGPDLSEIFYCAESLLLPEYRGQGIGHRFFDLRESQALGMGMKYSVFCSVMRRDDHPLRPPHHTPLDAFWRKRGYTPQPDKIASFSWKDIDQSAETRHDLQFWMRAL